MTHDELLEKVKQTLENYLNLRRYAKRDLKLISYAIDSLKALRAVVELHKPIEITLPSGIQAQDCISCDGHNYPCETVDAIEKELEVG